VFSRKIYQKECDYDKFLRDLEVFLFFPAVTRQVLLKATGCDWGDTDNVQASSGYRLEHQWQAMHVLPCYLAFNNQFH
jgi:hypothetical protein